MIRYDAVEKNFLTEDNADPLYLCWDSNELEFLACEGGVMYSDDDEEERAKIGQLAVAAILAAGEISLYPERDKKIKVVELPDECKEKLRELSRFLE